MNILRRSLTFAAAGLLAVGLAACNSDTETGSEHDHSAHDSAADVTETADAAVAQDHAAAAEGGAAHAMDGHDGAGMEAMAGAAAMPAGLKKIEPSADYPLTTCVVSGEELGGDMGDAIAYEYDGVEVQFCCAGCVKEFKASPDEFLAEVRAASAR